MQTAEDALAKRGDVLEDEEVLMGDLMAEMQAATEQTTGNTTIKVGADRAVHAYDVVDALVDKLKDQLTEAKRSLKEAGDLVTVYNGKLDALVDPDTEAIQERMNANQEINANVREKLRQDKLSGELSAADLLWKDKDGQISALKRKKVAAFKAIDLPDGFEITDDDITVDGTAIGGLSGGEKVKAGVRLAVNDGRLRLVIIEDGSALDADSLKECVDIVVAAGRVALVETIKLPGEAVYSYEMHGGAVKE